MRVVALTLFVAALLVSEAVLAECPTAEAIQIFVKDWQAKRPTKALPVSDMRDAVCARDKLVEALTNSQGKVVGYKAGLTAKAVQERFNWNAPVAGLVLEKMVLNDGATVPAAFGARPVWESDMLLVVKDDGVNQAKTPEEALRHISGMRPYIELNDIALGPNEKIDGLQLIAINVAARLGVAGPEVPLENTPDTLMRLAETKIVATDESGATLAEGVGAATLGNPLSVVVWLAEDLAKNGRKLNAGDLISVGAFSPLTPPKPGQTVTVRYEGLPNMPKVSVRFE
ncbi:hydratase [Bradyrhizobium hipponense]|uniref:Hydratase n=1 Tax=Bradyrhizobium hipponense TaxID=2605638 RepID=A0A5S4YL48_9BRAD|nr:fumarylacetoacetate hydrolase family protein [Bradyrhizobium hipponense]TYO64334.1 hydratase [Bradyrhizobium hipponense]